MTTEQQTLSLVTESEEAGIRVYRAGELFFVEIRTKESDTPYVDDDNSEWVFSSVEFSSLYQVNEVFSTRQREDGEQVWREGTWRVVARGFDFVIQRLNEVTSDWYDGILPPCVSIVPQPQIQFATAIEAIESILDR